jgi:hypothetical protein
MHHYSVGDREEGTCVEGGAKLPLDSLDGVHRFVAVPFLLQWCGSTYMLACSAGKPHSELPAHVQRALDGGKMPSDSYGAYEKRLRSKAIVVIDASDESCQFIQTEAPRGSA